ncbi:MAG TPA: hypothetical protein VKB02_12550 [Pyrinomonadaceae bacterium]|nr:hypothetical protein [Pyrinomonadaceae bacterium]
MKPHIRKVMFSLFSAAVICVLLASGCKKETGNPVPPAGTRVTTKAGKSDAFKQTARSLQDECNRIGCTCFLDGIQTTCGVVFACLDAGFCELMRAT